MVDFCLWRVSVASALVACLATPARMALVLLLGAAQDHLGLSLSMWFVSASRPGVDGPLTPLFSGRFSQLAVSVMRRIICWYPSVSHRPWGGAVVFVPFLCSQESSQSIVIQGVRFLPGAPGPRELCFAWREFAECVRLNVSPGPPDLLCLLEKPEEVPLPPPPSPLELNGNCRCTAAERTR